MSHGECPVGCGRAVLPGRLMCAMCWRQVPKHLQSDVYRTWRATQRDRDNFPAYRQAREAAIASVA